MCKDICIPADAEASIKLGASVRDPDGTARVEEASAAVPKPGGAVSGVLVEMADGKPVLKLSLSEAVDDIFVETAGTAYFRAPVFSADGRQAALVIDNVSDAEALRGLEATLTYTRSGQGFEQRVTLR